MKRPHDDLDLFPVWPLLAGAVLFFAVTGFVAGLLYPIFM